MRHHQLMTVVFLLLSGRRHRILRVVVQQTAPIARVEVLGDEVLAAGGPRPHVRLDVDHAGHHVGGRPLRPIVEGLALVLVVVRNAQHVAQLVGDGEGGAEAGVLDDGAAAGGVADLARVGEADGVAGHLSAARCLLIDISRRAESRRRRGGGGG